MSRKPRKTVCQRAIDALHRWSGRVQGAQVEESARTVAGYLAGYFAGWRAAKLERK